MLDRCWDNITDHHFRSILRGVDPILQVSVFMVVACHIVLGVGHWGCNFMLSMLQYVVQLAFMHSQSRLLQHDQKVMSDFPGDIRSATAQFLLDRKHTIYTVCPNPKCHHTHKPVFNGDSPIPNYPMYCTYVKYGKWCKEHLLWPCVYGSNVQVPIKPFVYFDFKDWVDIPSRFWGPDGCCLGCYGDQ